MRTDSTIAAARQNGFTLLELICVVTILALLGMISVPKLFNLADLARNVSAEITEDAFGKSVRMAQLACLTALWRNRDNLPGFGDGNLDFNSACYPTDTADQNRIAGQADRCITVWNALLDMAPSIAVAPTPAPGSNGKGNGGGKGVGNGKGGGNGGGGGGGAGGGGGTVADTVTNPDFLAYAQGETCRYEYRRRDTFPPPEFSYDADTGFVD